MKILISLMLFLFIFSSSCNIATKEYLELSKISDKNIEASAESVLVDNGDIYIAGFTILRLAEHEACYWKNGRRVDLVNEGGLSGVNDMAFFDGNLYLAGFDDINYDSQACYWLNDEVIFLENKDKQRSSRIESIYVFNNNLYFVGNYEIKGDYYLKPAFWINGEMTEIQIPGQLEDDAYIWDVAVANEDVYLVGKYYTMDNRSVPCYWLNGNLYNLNAIENNGITATQIIIDNKDIYIFGFYIDEYRNTRICYWKNGTFNVITEEGEDEWMPLFLINNGDIYILFHKRSDRNGKVRPVLSKNGVPYNLTDDFVDGRAIQGNVWAKDMMIADNTIYIAGTYQWNYFKNGVCYWEGQLSELTVSR